MGMRMSRSRDTIVGKSYCRNAAERIEQPLRTLFDNHDKELIRTADAVLNTLVK